MNTHTLAELLAMALKFRDERDWAQFHTPKELAISLVVESAELLELMQWKKGPELDATVQRRRQDIADELADCLHSVLLLSEAMQVDLGEAFIHKLRLAEHKYPADKVRGRAIKYTEIDQENPTLPKPPV